MKKKVLIVSHDEDGSARFIIERLNEIEQPCNLVDLGLYPDKYKGTLSFSSHPPRARLESEGWSISPNEVKSIWWRLNVRRIFKN